MNKWKAVIVGCGNIAGDYDERLSGNSVLTHAKAYRLSARFDLAAVMDAELSKAREFAKVRSVPASYRDLEEMLDKERPEVVSICSPNRFHEEQVMTALRYVPRAILCEKPMTLDAAASARMANAAAAAGVLLAVNYLRRWDVSLRALGGRIARGEFGSAKHARVVYTKGVFHNGSHAIHQLEHWFGAMGDPVIHASRPFEPNDPQVDFTVAFERCPSASFVGLDADSYAAFEMEIFFENARVRLVGGGAEIEISHAVPSAVVPGTRTLGVPERAPGTLSTAMSAVVDHLALALDGTERLVVLPEEAVETMRSCERIREATKENG